MLGKGVYDAEGHKNEKFLGAKNIGPSPEACREAWAQIKMEAMENCDLTEGEEQEEWGKLGPLAESTPANAKNRGAADRRRRRTERGNYRERSDEHRPGGMEGQGLGSGRGQTMDVAREGDNKGLGKGEGSDESETEEVRRAMAEAIWEIKKKG